MATIRKQIEKVQTLHPAGKRGVNIDRQKYESMRKALLRVIPKNARGVAFGDLPALVSPRLDRAAYPPEASVPWYLVTVKQDLEARGLIEQVPGAKPQHVRRAKAAAR